MKIGKTFAVTASLVLVAVGLALPAYGQQLTGRAEQRLKREVHHQLVMLPFYTLFDNFQYRIDGSTVVLLGQVTKPTLKTDAERVVRRIEGVEKVNNQIEVLPLSPNDDRIRLAEYRAIYHNDVLSRYALRAVPTIHIIVRNGNVTLTGAVGSDTDKNLAYMQASGVPGVFSVTNDLTVDKS